jgi:putative sterol carrier protein
MNLTVTDAPFANGSIIVSLDSTHGALALGRGHLPRADVTIKVDWATAKALLLEGDTSAAMSAFMAGKVTVEGDMAKLVALQGAPLDAGSRDVVDRLRAITA